MRGDNFIDSYRSAAEFYRHKQALQDLANAGPLAESTGRAALGADLSQGMFNERRANQAGAGVNYDPDSLRFGGEPSDGVRDRGADWRDPESPWQQACRGEVPTSDIPLLFPVKQGLTY